MPRPGTARANAHAPVPGRRQDSLQSGVRPGGRSSPLPGGRVSCAALSSGGSRPGVRSLGSGGALRTCCRLLALTPRTPRRPGRVLAPGSSVLPLPLASAGGSPGRGLAQDPGRRLVSALRPGPAAGSVGGPAGSTDRPLGKWLCIFDSCVSSEETPWDDSRSAARASFKLTRHNPPRGSRLVYVCTCFV